MNLQAQSFGILYRNSTVKEIERHCRQLPGADAICENPDNWRAYVQERYGRKYVAERGDLVTADDWMDFCRGMEKGYTFRYTAYIEKGERIGGIAEGTYRGQGFDILPQDLYLQPDNFILNGIFLRPGPTIHYVTLIFIRYTVLLKDLNVDDEYTARIFSGTGLVMEWITEYLNLMVFKNERLAHLEPSKIRLSIDGQLEEDAPGKTLNSADPLSFIANYALNGYPDKLYEFGIRFADIPQINVVVTWYPATKRDIS